MEDSRAPTTTPDLVDLKQDLTSMGGWQPSKDLAFHSDTEVHNRQKSQSLDASAQSKKTATHSKGTGRATPSSSSPAKSSASSSSGWNDKIGNERVILKEPSLVKFADDLVKPQKDTPSGSSSVRRELSLGIQCKLCLLHFTKPEDLCSHISESHKNVKLMSVCNHTWSQNSFRELPTNALIKLSREECGQCYAPLKPVALSVRAPALASIKCGHILCRECYLDQFSKGMYYKCHYLGCGTDSCAFDYQQVQTDCDCEKFQIFWDLASCTQPISVMVDVNQHIMSNQPKQDHTTKTNLPQVRTSSMQPFSTGPSTSNLKTATLDLKGSPQDFSRASISPKPHVNEESIGNRQLLSAQATQGSKITGPSKGKGVEKRRSTPPKITVSDLSDEESTHGGIAPPRVARRQHTTNREKAGRANSQPTNRISHMHHKYAADNNNILLDDCISITTDESMGEETDFDDIDGQMDSSTAGRYFSANDIQTWRAGLRSCTNGDGSTGGTGGSGPSANTGASGTSGASGNSGASGTSGTSGNSGGSGSFGNFGASGASGTPGAPGAPGAPGGSGSNSGPPDKGGSNKRQRVEDDNNDEQRRFACPFFKYDPQKYNPGYHLHFRACAGPGWRTFKDVKDHIFRRHLAPIFCPRCFEVFKTQGELGQHQQQDVACIRRNPPAIEGVTLNHRDRIKKEPRQCQTEEEKWIKVYQIIFNVTSVWDVPEPYHEGKVTRDNGPTMLSFLNEQCCARMHAVALQSIAETQESQGLVFMDEGSAGILSQALERHLRFLTSRVAAAWGAGKRETIYLPQYDGPSLIPNLEPEQLPNTAHQGSNGSSNNVEESNEANNMPPPTDESDHSWDNNFSQYPDFDQNIGEGFVELGLTPPDRENSGLEKGGYNYAH